MTWKTKDVTNSEHPLIQHGLQNLIRLNPDWSVIISDDDEVDRYLRQCMSYNDYKLVHNLGIVQKSDIWRLYKMYNEGGMYVDIDRLCNVMLTSSIRQGVRWVLPVCNNRDFSHDMMITAPYNPAYRTAIDLYIQRLHEGHTSVYFLGPQTYMHAITLTVFQSMVDVNPGYDVFQQIKQSLSDISFIQVVDELPPYRTFLYNGQVDFDHEKIKRDFYGKTGIRHWTNEW